MSKEAMRQAMPITAAIVDEFRELLADGGRLIFASEDGLVIDRREPVSEDQVFTIPANYAPMREFGKKERA
jgi:hypothetical protein